MGGRVIRRGVDLIQETALYLLSASNDKSQGHRLCERAERTHSITPIEDPREAPWSVLERLNVHDLDKEQVPWLGALDLEGPGKVVDPGEVDILYIVGAVVVLDLAARPGIYQHGFCVVERL